MRIHPSALSMKIQNHKILQVNFSCRYFNFFIYYLDKKSRLLFLRKHLIIIKIKNKIMSKRIIPNRINNAISSIFKYSETKQNLIKLVFVNFV